jgi:nucleoside-diphosphate-sugar epimerase
VLRRKRNGCALVTGGAGFVGSHLAELLLADGYEVVAFDNLSTGQLDNLEPVIDDPRFELVVGDVGDEALLAQVVSRCDVVFHLAAAVGVKLILTEPLQSLKTNIGGTESVLRAASARRTPVLIASTSEVYGKVVRIPQREEDDVLLGSTRYSRWSYAASKMLDEFLGLAYARQGLPVVIFRLFNTVGPRQTGRYGMVLPRFVGAALRDEPLEVHGDGMQTRCFVHVRDAVEALHRLARTPEAAGQVFNVGSAESVSILELARRVLGEVGEGRLRDGLEPPAEELIRFIPYDVAYPGGEFEDIRVRRPDISKIRRVTRWRPKRSLTDIVRDVVAHEEAVTAVRADELLGEYAPA